MLIFLVTGIVDLLLLIHYFIYSKEYKDAFKSLPKGDVVPKERMLEEVKGNRNIGLIIYFGLWFGLAIGLTMLLYRYSINTDRGIEQLLLPRGSYIYYMVVVMLPALFFVSNLFESIRNKVPLIYTQVDYSPILYSEKYDKFYLKKYPLFVLIEIIVISVAGIFCFLIYDSYVYATRDQLAINRFFSVQDSAYLYSDMEEIEVKFYADDGHLGLKYVLYVEDKKIILDDYFSVDSKVEAELYIHQKIILAIARYEDIQLNLTLLSDDTFSQLLSRMNDDYANFLQTVRDDYEALI